MTHIRMYLEASHTSTGKMAIWFICPVIYRISSMACVCVVQGKAPYAVAHCMKLRMWDGHGGQQLKRCHVSQPYHRVPSCSFSLILTMHWPELMGYSWLLSWWLYQPPMLCNNWQNFTQIGRSFRHCLPQTTTITKSFHDLIWNISSSYMKFMRKCLTRLVNLYQTWRRLNTIVDW